MREYSPGSLAPGDVSAEQARERYGVMLDAADVVDVEATVARRCRPPGSTPPNI
jgi:hypothetical protein